MRLCSKGGMGIIVQGKYQQKAGPPRRKKAASGGCRAFPAAAGIGRRGRSGSEASSSKARVSKKNPAQEKGSIREMPGRPGGSGNWTKGAKRKRGQFVQSTRHGAEPGAGKRQHRGDAGPPWRQRELDEGGEAGARPVRPKRASVRRTRRRREGRGACDRFRREPCRA